MLCTIEIGSCVLVQGEFVQRLGDGAVVIRDGATLYRGRPVGPTDAGAARPKHAAAAGAPATLN